MLFIHSTIVRTDTRLESQLEYSSLMGYVNFLMPLRSFVARRVVSLSPDLIENLFTREKNHFFMKTITKFQIFLIKLTWYLKVENSHFAFRIGGLRRYSFLCLFQYYLSIPPKSSGSLVNRVL